MSPESLAFDSRSKDSFRCQREPAFQLIHGGGSGVLEHLDSMRSVKGETFPRLSDVEEITHIFFAEMLSSTTGHCMCIDRLLWAWPCARQCGGCTDDRGSDSTPLDGRVIIQQGGPFHLSSKPGYTLQAGGILVNIYPGTTDIN